MKTWLKFIVVVLLTFPALTFAESLKDNLLRAVWSGQTDMVKELIKDGADVNASYTVENNAGWTALMAAAWSGKIDTIKALIEAGADVNAKRDDGWTVLMAAVCNGKTEAVKALIEAGADVNASCTVDTNKTGHTVLMEAAYNGKVDSIKVLVEARADVNTKRNDGWTALMEAVTKENIDAIKALIEARADVNAKRNDGQTALMEAAYKGNTDAVKALIEAGADVNARRNNGQTALISAAENGNVDAVKVLIKAKIDVNAERNEGSRMTALMAAANNGKTEAIKALIEAGVDVNAKNKCGMTALMWAASSGNDDAVSLLIAAKADIDATDKDNSTALMYAEQNYQTKTVELLKKAGVECYSLPEYISNAKPGLSSEKTADGYFPGDTWRTSTPEAQGMDSGYLANMLKYIISNNVNIHSVVIVRHGYVVLEAYNDPFGKDDIQILKSCTKSVASALVGIAIREGYIKSVDQRVVPIFPGQKIRNLDEKKQMVTIKHLLTMSSGISQQEVDSFIPDEYWNSGNWNRYYLDQPMVAQPGTLFAYDSAGVCLLMSILHETSGMENSEFAEKFLFKPIGITNYYWGTDPQGDFDGGAGLAMTPMEMAKFGYLYLNKGRWNGQQVIPADWVEVSMSDHIKPYDWVSADKGYGYLWWELPFGGFTAAGHGGQYIMVMPEKDMVVVMTAGLNAFVDNWRVEHYLTEDCINKSIISNGSILENPAEQAELNSAIRCLGNPAAISKISVPEMAYEISAKKYVIDQNPQNLKAIILNFNGTNECTCESDWPGNFKISVGLDGKYRRSNPYNDLHKQVLARGKWANKNTFVLECYSKWNEENKIQYTLQYNNDKLKMTAEKTGGEWSREYSGTIEK
jgi:ankyrin repeat protein/CubicO group peptidase (beta-lactamase class C family)